MVLCGNIVLRWSDLCSSRFLVDLHVVEGNRPPFAGLWEGENGILLNSCTLAIIWWRDLAGQGDIKRF